MQPSKDETKDSFINRCVSELDDLNENEAKQVCEQIWDEFDSGKYNLIGKEL